MALYLLEGQPNERTFIYAREPQHIISLVNHYRQKLTPEDKAHPELHSWVKNKPTLDRIVDVKEGGLMFVGSPIAMGGDGEVFNVRLRVTPDFEVGLPEESLPAFMLWRSNILDRKRESLYKAHVSHAFFGGQYFIPEDIARAIVEFDVTPEIGRASPALRNLETLRHKNLRVATMKDVQDKKRRK